MPWRNESLPDHERFVALVGDYRVFHRRILLALVALFLIQLALAGAELTTYLRQVHANTQRIADIQRSREESAADTCRTIRKVIVQSYSSDTGHVTLPARLSNGQTVSLEIKTPNGKMQAAKAIKADGLQNCALRGIRQAHVPSPPS